MQKRGTLRLDTWLTQILVALIRKGGGELRISGYDLEDAAGRFILFTDWDGGNKELILRFGTGAAEAIVVNTEQQWTQRTENSQPSPASSPSPERSRSAPPLDDEQLASVERKLMQRAAERQMRRQDQEAARVRQEMFQE